MTISALPSAPNKAIDTTQQFADKADAFVAALSTFVTEANALQVDVNSKQSTATSAASTATTQADLAAASAASAIAAPGTSATSTTSLAVGTGSKSLTVETGKDLVVGMAVMIVSTVSPSNWMHGIITSYTTGTGALVVTVDTISGSGTITAWTVSISAPLAPSLGVGQEWTQLSSSRLFNTVYQNTTGKPISVMISASMTITSGGFGYRDLTAYVGTTENPNIMADQETYYNMTGSNMSVYPTLTFIVPLNHYYRVEHDTATSTMGAANWNELR